MRKAKIALAVALSALTLLAFFLRPSVATPDERAILSATLAQGLGRGKCAGTWTTLERRGTYGFSALDRKNREKRALDQAEERAAGRNVRLIAGSSDGVRPFQIASDSLGLSCFYPPIRFGTPRINGDLAFVTVLHDEHFWVIYALKRSRDHWRVIDEAWGDNLPVV